MRIEAARLAILVFHRIGRNDALACRVGPDPADPAPAGADHVLVDNEPFLTVLTFDQPRRPIAIGWVDVVAPQVERFQDMTIGIDHVVCAGHRRSSRFNSGTLSYRAGWRCAMDFLNSVQNAVQLSRLAWGCPAS